MGRVLNLLWRAGHFFTTKLFRPDHPLHQSGIILWYIILIIKEYHCNKNERKRLSGWCFMRISAIYPMEITTLGLHAPCVLNPVYLSTQSDPHKTGHMLR